MYHIKNNGKTLYNYNVFNYGDYYNVPNEVLCTPVIFFQVASLLIDGLHYS